MEKENNEKAILSEIQQAYERREIKAFFQPINDSVSGRVICAEALSRWVKEDGTVRMPGDYIPILEESDAICDLDWYMLKEVCSTLKEQKAKGVPCVKVSVNFSRKHVSDRDFISHLCRIVDDYQVDHALIQVEITETALSDNSPEQLDAFVKAIRAQGFTVAVDDFGSGMSSLSMVKDVTMDTLKVDRSLLSKNCEDEKERIVLESILEFARRLKLVTIVEGVETKEQLGFLRTCGCEMIQGYLFSKPMPKEEFWELCKEDVGKPLEEESADWLNRVSAVQLLLEVIYTRYPLIIYANLTRNSYYMMNYEDFTTRSCSTAGTFDDCILQASDTMHPEDQELFRQTFCAKNLMAAYERGERCISLKVRQLGDDKIYRWVEVADYFIKPPSIEDVLAISLCRNLEE